MVLIQCAGQWEKYVRTVMNDHSPSVEVVVRRVGVDPNPRRFSRPMGQRAHFDPPVLEPVMDVEVAPTIPDAESAPNEIVGHVCRIVDDVVDSPNEFLFTQNDPSKCLISFYCWELTLFIPSISSLLIFVLNVVGDIPENVDVPLVAAQVQCGDGLCGSNSVEIMNDEDAYEMGVDLDSDDDRPAGEMAESDIEMFRRIFPGRRDPIVHEFSDLTLSDQAFAEGHDDELLEAPEASSSMRWLQAFAVIRKRPYKVLHSHVEHRYTVVCDKERCPWRVCARKQNITGKWKITKVVGPHNCADHELTVRHPQLTSTLIAKRLMGILKEQPNMKVRTIIRTESGYEQLPVLFNAIKAVNPGIHYEHIPKPNAWKDGRQIFGHAFWCFPQCVEAFRHCRPVFSIDGTFLIGKYRGTLLIAISCDANNMLVPLAFALVERENNWGWFLRLVRIHVVGPRREVGVISDRHQGILHAVQEQIKGYPPLHHRWCTRHLAENLLRKDGVKDNFDLTATNAEGRQWLAGLMRDLDKWTRSHDTGGWRYEFQCSNMVESFNKLLLGTRGMPMNAIVEFTFYRLVAWFNERHAKAEALQGAGERWAEKPKRHLSITNERASTHEVQCFDLGTGTYQVKHRDGTTSDGEIRESRIHVVVLRDFKCTCGRPRQYHFVCSHLVAAARHRNFDIESMIPHDPCFVPFRDPREWPPYDGPKYVVDPAYRWKKRGTRKRTRHNMTMDQVSGRMRRGRATPFLTDPEQNECGKWWPETHSFHLPFGEMTVTLQDCQKMLGLSIRGNPVTGPCVSEEVEDQGTRTSEVLISWLREHFGHCPQDADAETVRHYCRAWILHLFACVLFPDATGDTASWIWGLVVLCFLYRQLCEACRRTSGSTSVGGCVYLLQLWMWAHLPVGRPEIMGHRPWFPGEPLRRQPTWAYLWDQVKVGHTRLERAYLDYITELDALTAHSVNWQPYEGEDALPFAVSVMCAADDDLYRMKCPLICFYAVEYNLPDRVARQFGIS
uniref:SWIM-type domain-containing protein n=1 Tax=Setaria italica TaxID=4555 RepID=K4A1T2_SETIT